MPSPPPPLHVERVKVSAKLDYVTFSNDGIKVPIPRLSGSHEWTRARGSSTWILTVQDPTRADLETIIEAYSDPLVMGLELAVDFAPVTPSTEPDHASELQALFLAVAARFRPEDKALWDFAARGAVSRRGVPPDPLERRMARPNEEVIYGGRGEFMQAKLYLKDQDQGRPLAADHHRVRTEVALKRNACMEFELDRASDLLGFPYRKAFATLFRFVDHPELRARRGRTEGEAKKLAAQMNRAWATGGVSKFEPGARPRVDRLEVAATRVARRGKAQLPATEFRLVRDQKANAKVGNALMQLQRRMAIRAKP